MAAKMEFCRKVVGLDCQAMKNQGVHVDIKFRGTLQKTVLWSQCSKLMKTPRQVEPDTKEAKDEPKSQ